MINICYSLSFITAGKVMRRALQIIRSAFIFRCERIYGTTLAFLYEHHYV